MALFQIEKSVVYLKWANRELNQAIITFGLQDRKAAPPQEEQKK